MSVDTLDRETDRLRRGELGVLVVMTAEGGGTIGQSRGGRVIIVADS